ncbi:phage tail protein [Streptococcus agalactiae]|uniref:phage tail protein n=1 Tax=Streptococcus agalactiae TaxID=1311 RepID=UPI000B29DE9B|nr:phage tail protein [Streptococcus agalactiae]
MQITFYDKNMFETAVADNALMNAIKIKKASLTSLFEEATHQVEFEFSKEFGEWWGIRENGYLAFRFKGDFFRFSIVKFKEDAKTNTITIVGDYFNLEMLNENCIAYEKQPARTIVQHFNAMEILPYANFEIGVNELANSTRVLTYTGDEVKYKRLISIINNFGGECEFEIKQKANGQFDKLILNIYKANDGVNYQGVGRNRRDLEITIDNSNNVSRMVDSTEIKTSIEPIGKDGLRLGNRGTTWKNEDGQVEFYQKNNRIYAPLAADEMQRVLDSDKFLLWKQSIDTDNVAKLESEGLKWLKNVCYAKENIEVSGSFDVRVGDTVILNHKGIGKYGILGSLRVTKIVWDLLTETNEVTFSNFKRLASKISAQGLALQESIETPASYDIQFNTTGGTVFKNNTGSSNVSFNFSKNGAQTAVLGARWYSGTQLLSTGLEVMVKPDKLVDDKLVLRLEVDVTDSITYSKELTFINVNDGVKGDQGNGITSTENYYLVSPNKTGITTATSGWVRDIPQIASPTNKYHWHYHVDIYLDGTRKETVPAIIGIYGDQGLKGDTGVGILSTSVAYGMSSTNTIHPTSWTNTQPTVPPGQYLWKRTITDYTDPNKPDTIEITYTYQGKDGVQGQPGVAGTSVSVSKIEYQVGTNPTTAPTGTWSASMVSAPAGQYLWSKTTMSDNSVIYGINRQGVDGKIPFFAYANSADGKTDFSTTDSTNKQYIGTFTGYTQSTNYLDYKWVDMVGSVEVGNKNLILKSNDFLNPHKQSGTNTTVTSTDDCFVIKSTGYTANAWGGTAWNMSISEVKAGEEFSILMPVYIDSSIALDDDFNISIKNHTLNVATYSYHIPKNKKDEWFNVAITFKTTIDMEFDTRPFYVHLVKNGLVRIKPPMLVRGNVIPSDYVSAPEDIDAKIDTKVDQELNQAQMLALEERTAIARENAIAEAMQNTLSEVETKWKLWYDLNTTDEKQKVANDIALLFDRTAEFKQLLGEATAKFSFINNETLIGEEGIAIGDKDGKAKLFLSNDSISFVTNGVAQMTLTGDTLTIKNGLFTERIQIGNFIEEVYDRNPLFNVIRAVRNS